MKKPHILKLRTIGTELVMNEDWQKRNAVASIMNFILDDLMPWHKISYDISVLEVNRLVA